MFAEVRARLEREAERLVRGGDDREVRDQRGWITHLIEALPHAESGSIPVGRVGFGSSVLVRDLDSGGEFLYRLLAGEGIDIDGGEVSLASPIGQALLGRRPGDEVGVSTPLGERRLHVVALTTLPEMLEMDDPADAVLSRPLRTGT